MSAGLMPFGALSPADITRLMQQARPQVDVGADDVPAAIPPGFTGFVPPTAPTMQPQVAAAAPAAEPEAPARAPLRMFGSLPPQMSAPVAAEPARSPLPSLVGSQTPAMPPRAPVAPHGDDEVPAAAAPARPLTFGSLPAPTAPATTGSTAAPAAAAPTAAMPAAEPSLLDRIGSGLRNLNANGGGDLLTSLGIGLMSTPGFGRGAAAGLKAYQDNEGKRAASDLARAEFGLKVRKDAQEQRQLTGNAQYVTSKIPGISPDQALTLGGNPAFMNELFKGVLPPAELYKQYTDADGNRWNRNERTGQETVALQAKDDKTVTPVSEADRVALGLPAGSYQKDANGKISPINATGTTINMGAEKAQDATVGKAYGDYQVDLATKGRNAGNTLNSLALMEQAARNPNFYSGTGAETVKRANQFLVAMGVKDANYTKPTEVFDALSNKVVLDGLGGSLGPGISNTDRDYIGRTAPTLAQSQAGNLELIAIARSLAQRQQAVAKLGRDYAAANGGRLDSGFDQKLEEYAAANPLFPAAQASATQRSDGATGANGPGGIAAPRSQADFDALPKGAMYVDPADGRRYRKN
ncbi:hypothetical protein [Methylobacterium radiotolerans]|uniref:Uncharacterized protein n=1 Tax=Methylobacterium radiotolerans (strain ATCC 27329 / DSM 1819 / JCM 2831 / NBRC 15690 / NCIMB 10815 / 0-1) TaxID=426355 RepID=B1M1P4_METRJ|nr:hypothetical protein [Methylobacterium radiotolerans]ACB27627.1 hypothetical protein Mrad2831_5682 [Methylobacterium radiotolerans JCM 2831]GEM95930.1 hypothetical protein MRA01_04700 [Methylobacterium radiotolerans]